MVVGLISDTHALLRPEALAALDGVSLIFHAGDVGGRSILQQLRAIAPVHAVSGNVDVADAGLVPSIDMDVEGLVIHVSHGHELGTPTPEKLVSRYPAADVIVYGHTHRALIERHGHRLVVNPGAAGPRRFDIQPSVAMLTIEPGATSAEILWLA